MEFNTLVKTQLFPILQKFGFEIIAEFKNILRFQSSVLKLNLVFNEYDKTFLVEIGKQDDTLYPLNDYAIEKLFDISLSIEKVATDVFVRNLSLLFDTKEGIEILKGNIQPLKNVIMQQSENYTSDLLLKQTLEIASKAWDANDYVTFIKSIDEIGVSNLPQSFQLKYKIAKQKL